MEKNGGCSWLVVVGLVFVVAAIVATAGPAEQGLEAVNGLSSVFGPLEYRDTWTRVTAKAVKIWQIVEDQIKLTFGMAAVGIVIAKANPQSGPGAVMDKTDSSKADGSWVQEYIRAERERKQLEADAKVITWANTKARVLKARVTLDYSGRFVKATVYVPWVEIGDLSSEAQWRDLDVGLMHVEGKGFAVVVSHELWRTDDCR